MQHYVLGRVLWYSLAVLGLSATLWAQSDTAQISGFVKDPTGSVIPNSSVTVKNEDTGLERKTATHAGGYYVIPNLPSGFYTVTVEAVGFKKFITTQNKLDANMAGTVDVRLDHGAVTESVEVTGSGATVQAETATLGRLVEGSQIQGLMLNGRNPIWLALLKAGVRGNSSLATFSYDFPQLPNINGGRAQDLVVTSDGAVGLRTRGDGATIGVADVEAVQEIQILTANYNAEYGRSGAGQIRLVTKSGTRQFHGSFYEYLRNEKLDANSWSRNRLGQLRPANKLNQFGYVVSGPVYLPGKWNTDRSKLFFLWSQEWVRFRQGMTSIITVPTLAMRQGDFSELLSPANPYFGRRTVNDPDTGASFANNIIPASRLSPNGLAFLRAYPEPTPGFLQGRANFFQSRAQPTDQRKDTISIDFLPAEKHIVRLRHQNYSFRRLEAFGTLTDRAPGDFDRPNRTASVNHI